MGEVCILMDTHAKQHKPDLACFGLLVCGFMQLISCCSFVVLLKHCPWKKYSNAVKCLCLPMSYSSHTLVKSQQGRTSNNCVRILCRRPHTTCFVRGLTVGNTGLTCG